MVLSHYNSPSKPEVIRNGRGYFEKTAAMDLCCERSDARPRALPLARPIFPMSSLPSQESRACLNYPLKMPVIK
jgi:hypothetical protein